MFIYNGRYYWSYTDPEDGDREFPRNAGKRLSDLTASYTGRCLPLWEPQMSPSITVLTAKFEQQYSQKEGKEQTQKQTIKGKTERNKDRDRERERTKIGGYS
jgi:hypothetical protein